MPPPYEIRLNAPLCPDQTSCNNASVAIDLDIDPHKDSYVIRGAQGVAVTHVRKPDGRVLSARVQANGALQQFTSFDSNAISVSERRELEYRLYKESRLRQTEIADLLGVSQATVANDLKIIRSGSA